MKHRFGWLPDLPDVRDIQFRKVFRLPAELPSNVDLRGDCSPVEDQGELGSCTAQALVGALEFLQNTEGVPTFADLSRLFVYFSERVLEGTVLWDNGAMLRTGIKVLRVAGACREELWPYDVTQFKRPPAKICYAEGLKHRVVAYQRLTSLPEMKSCLAMGLPFVFGYSVYESGMTEEVEKTGVIPMPTDTDQLLGGHAIMAVGYDDAEQMLLFRNSWGVKWGDNGYGKIPYAYLEMRDLTDDFWCIQSTTSNVYAALRIEHDEAMA